MHINHKMIDFVTNLLKSDIPSSYYYHNYGHSLYVMQQAAVIGKYENCTAAEMELLQVAAIWHDTGYLHTYKDHEEASCVLVNKHLPGFGYNQQQIDEICGMIMATKIPQQPKNKLEEIIADADLEYLGTPQAAKWADDLFKELQELNPATDRDAWRRTEIEFLKQHRYFTRFCRHNREPAKLKYLDSILINATEV